MRHWPLSLEHSKEVKPYRVKSSGTVELIPALRPLRYREHMHRAGKPLQDEKASVKVVGKA